MFEKIAVMLGLKKNSGETFKSRLVLIVDDNQSDALLVRRTVEKMGHRVLMAENGRTGFELAKAQKPDLILSDCRMPEMDGVAMCRRIKQTPETKDIPMVFLTGVEAPTTVVECFDLGVDNYICKPINPSVLTGQITAIFKEHFEA